MKNQILVNSHKRGNFYTFIIYLLFYFFKYNPETGDVIRILWSLLLCRFNLLSLAQNKIERIFFFILPFLHTFSSKVLLATANVFSKRQEYKSADNYALDYKLIQIFCAAVTCRIIISSVIGFPILSAKCFPSQCGNLSHGEGIPPSVDLTWRMQLKRDYKWIRSFPESRGRTNLESNLQLQLNELKIIASILYWMQYISSLKTYFYFNWKIQRSKFLKVVFN